MPNRPDVYRSHPKRRSPDTNWPDATRRGYDRRWKAFRLSFLADNPTCVECAKQGLVVEATVVDHITPHKGDPEAFWNGPFQALCATCHNRKSAKE